MKKNIGSILIGLAYILFFTICCIYYYRMAIMYSSSLGTYFSDLPNHIASGVNGTGYSIVELAYGLIVNKLGLGNKTIGVFISFMTVGTTFLTYLLMRKIAPETNRFVLHVLAFVCMFVMPFYLPKINEFRYLGLQCGTIWHNTTYTGMRLAAILLFVFYYDWINHYLERFNAKDFILFTVLLCIVNMMKPNFIVAFGPAMLAVMIGDIIHSKGKGIKNWFAFGIPVLLSLVILIYEYKLLFPAEEASSSGSAIGFSIAYVLRLRAKHPVASLLQSAAFPLTVLIYNRKELIKDRFFRISWLTWLSGLVEFLFIHEEGFRKDHGNLSWGYSFCIYLVFLVSLSWFLKNVKVFYEEYQKDKDVKSYFINHKKDCIYLMLSAFFLLWHLYCGLEYFWLMLHGASFTI